MNLEERLAQIVRDAVEQALDQRLTDFETRLLARQAAVQATPPDPQLLTKQDVARHLRVDPRTVERMVERGEFPHPIHVSPNRIRWRPSDVDDHLDRRSPE